jgi:hypothetical protein
MSEKLDMTVTFRNVTRAQAIALEAMFNFWQSLGRAGSSRMVSFFADGDGNFRPTVDVAFGADPYPTTSEEEREALRRAAFITNGEESNELSIPLDFDAVAWKLHEQYDPKPVSPKVQAIKDHQAFMRQQEPWRTW